jgi:hypothetical protein
MNLGERGAAQNGWTLIGTSLRATIQGFILSILSILPILF